MGDAALPVVVFVCVYAGMALGRWPWLGIDRTGIALLGAIALHVGGAVDGRQAVAAIDWSTLFLLFGLMVLSAQFAACGFHDACAARLTASRASPATILALVIAVSGGLSALLTNDVVVFAMTPMLCAGIRARGLDPRPYLIGLAGGANAGSAATSIGNPQNILIGQSGGLDFFEFLAICGPPALAAMLVVHLVIALVWREALRPGATDGTAPPGSTQAPGDAPGPVVDRRGLAKALAASAAVLVLFATPVPQVTGVLAIAGALLISRRPTTPQLLGRVDWHLLVLFAGLFIVTSAFARTGLAGGALTALAEAGIDILDLGALSVLSLLASNTIGNVPAVMLLLALAPDPPAEALRALAVLTTLAGNLLIVGSLANIIVVERAAASGVRLGFLDHARCGVPMTLISGAIAIAWFAARGGLPL